MAQQCKKPAPNIADGASGVALATAFDHRGIKIAYTVPEAVFASGLSRSSLYISIGKGALRTKKCGRRTVILHEDLVNFLKALPNSIE